MRFLAFLTVLMALVTASAYAADKTLEVGQVWNVPEIGYEDTQLQIGRIEELGGETIVHVSIINAPLKLSSSETVYVPIGHMPMSYAAAQASVGDLISTGAEPYEFFEEGYVTWKENAGGFFTIPFIEITGQVNVEPHVE